MDSGFIRRWSRRKLGNEQDIKPGTAEGGTEPKTAEAQAPRETRAVDKAFENFDFDSLGFDSDYTRFMSSDVPEELRRRALRHLWTSSDIISEPDDLDDYLEDFREEAMALPAELAKSAYEVGRGFVAGEAETSPALDAAGRQQETTSPPAKAHASISAPGTQSDHKADPAPPSDADGEETPDARS